MRILLGKRMIGLLVFFAGIQIGIGQQTGIITNPVLPGFNPDPCIIGVASDYYIATSSFEWFPGIPIYHSKDLVNRKPKKCIFLSKKQAPGICMQLRAN